MPNVSRETLECLRAYEELVLKWTAKINLVSKGNREAVWQRHIADSIQVYQHAPASGLWADLGSGGGFPGIVAAILAKENSPDRPFILVESDRRKATFLRTAIRELELNAHVRAERIETTEPLGAHVLSARALTDLTGLLSFAERHLAPGGLCLFPKGATWREEDSRARLDYSYTCEAIPSQTEPAAALLKIKDITRV